MPTRKSPAVPETLTKAAVMPAAEPAKSPSPVEKSTPKQPAKAKPPATSTPVPPRKAVKTVEAAKVPAAPPAAAAAPALPAAKSPRPKDKLVRDSFTMPRADFVLIQQLKDRALGFARATKKSELLRAGLQALADLDDAQLRAQLGKLATIKAGRPTKTD